MELMIDSNLNNVREAIDQLDGLGIKFASEITRSMKCIKLSLLIISPFLSKIKDQTIVLEYS